MAHRKNKIQVLVVEDSPVAQMMLVQILNGDPDIQVIGTAKNGVEAIELLKEKNPDLILMDVHMPEMDGFEATRRIMETRPIPIVICSGSLSLKESTTGFRLMEAGAVAYIEKPVGHEHRDYQANVTDLRQTVKLMSEVKVVRRWPRREFPAARASSSAQPRQGKVEIIGMGASTGGPPVLQAILTDLPKNFPVPILIVQHIAPGFLQGLVEWLNQTTGFTVHAAAYGIHPIAGHVYFAPDDFHLGVRAGGALVLNKEAPEYGLRPSVGHLFRSLADHYGANALGVLLTGMGKDGAQELGMMKNRGAVTIVQDRETSVVHGMPGEAIALGAATHILSADKIAPAIMTLVNKS
jgi:two-component system chemotaxis response regulator CheB